MTLDELKEELTRDLPIKLTALQAEAAENAVLYGKWSRYNVDLKKELIQHQNSRKLEMKKALMYYTGRGDDVCLDVFDKTELRTIIPADDKVIVSNAAVELVEAKLDFCRYAQEAIKQRGFSIRAIIDIRKLEAGE